MEIKQEINIMGDKDDYALEEEIKIKHEEVSFELIEEVSPAEDCYGPIEAFESDNGNYNESMAISIKTERDCSEKIYENQNEVNFEYLSSESLLFSDIDIKEENAVNIEPENDEVTIKREELNEIDLGLDFPNDEVEIEVFLHPDDEQDPLAMACTSKNEVNTTEEINSIIPLQGNSLKLTTIEADGQQYRILQAEEVLKNSEDKLGPHNSKGLSFITTPVSSKKIRFISQPMEEISGIKPFSSRNNTPISAKKHSSYPVSMDELEKICSGVGSLKKSQIKKNYPKQKRFKNYCLYCKVFVIDFTRHLLKKHIHEREVQKISAKPLDSKERKDMINTIRKQGNCYHYETEDFKMKSQRPGISNITHLPCTYCFGLFERAVFWKHRKKCNKLNVRDVDELIEPAELLLKDVSVAKNIRDEIFPHMTVDMASFVAKSDVLICAFGVRCLKERSFVTITIQKMRELAKLLIQVRKNVGSFHKNLFQLLKPQKYVDIVESVHILAEFNPETKTFESPSYAINIYKSLKVCCEIALNALSDKGYIDSSLVGADRDLKAILELLNSNPTFVNIPKREKPKPVRFSPLQKQIIFDYFREHIITRRYPKKTECFNLIELNPGVFEDKPWSKLQTFVQQRMYKDNPFQIPLQRETHIEKDKRKNETKIVD